MAGKSDLVRDLASSIDGMTQSTASDVVDQVFQNISDLLARGDKVTLPGFGTFSVSHRAEREGRNPATGQTMVIPARNVAKFKAGKGLTDAING